MTAESMLSVEALMTMVVIDAKTVGTAARRRDQRSGRSAWQGVRVALCGLAASLMFACEGSFGPWKLDGTLTDSTWQTAACGVAVSNNLAAVCGEEASGGRLVSVFRRNSTSGSWSLLQRIYPRAGAPEPRFGQALALDGERLAIGAAGPTGSGSVPAGERLGYVDLYTYESEGGTLRFLYDRTVEALSSSGEFGSSDFASSLALDRRTLIVGARYANGGLGKAFVFDLSAGGPPVALSEPSVPVLSDQHFGESVDAAAGRVAVSKPVDCSQTPFAPEICPSEVFVYHRGSSGEWLSQRIVSPEVPSGPGVLYRDGFGASLALGSTWLAVADNSPHEGDPKVYLYRVSATGETWSYDRSFETSGVSRYGMASRASALAIADRGVRTDTGAAASRIRVYRIGTSADLEGQIILPTLEYASRIDVFGSNLISSDSISPANALVFRRSD